MTEEDHPRGARERAVRAGAGRDSRRCRLEEKLRGRDIRETCVAALFLRGSTRGMEIRRMTAAGGGEEEGILRGDEEELKLSEGSGGGGTPLTASTAAAGAGGAAAAAGAATAALQTRRTDRRTSSAAAAAALVVRGSSGRSRSARRPAWRTADALAACRSCPSCWDTR